MGLGEVTKSLRGNGERRELSVSPEGTLYPEHSVGKSALPPPQWWQSHPSFFFPATFKWHESLFPKLLPHPQAPNTLNQMNLLSCRLAQVFSDLGLTHIPCSLHPYIYLSVSWDLFSVLSQCGLKKEVYCQVDAGFEGPVLHSLKSYRSKKPFPCVSLPPTAFTCPTHLGISFGH